MNSTYLDIHTHCERSTGVVSLLVIRIDTLHRYWRSRDCRSIWATLSSKWWLYEHRPRSTSRHIWTQSKQVLKMTNTAKMNSTLRRILIPHFRSNKSKNILFPKAAATSNDVLWLPSFCIGSNHWPIKNVNLLIASGLQWWFCCAVRTCRSVSPSLFTAL